MRASDFACLKRALPTDPKSSSSQSFLELRTPCPAAWWIYCECWSLASCSKCENRSSSCTPELLQEWGPWLLSSWLAAQAMQALLPPAQILREIDVSRAILVQLSKSLVASACCSRCGAVPCNRVWLDEPNLEELHASKSVRRTCRQLIPEYHGRLHNCKATHRTNGDKGFNFRLQSSLSQA